MRSMCLLKTCITSSAIRRSRRISCLTRVAVSSARSLFANKPPTASPLAIQYADYTEWQKQTLQGEELERQVSYWKKELGNEMPTLSLPSDHPRPAAIDFSGDSAGFALPKATVEGLKALSREQGVTLFITLLTAFKMLLHRYAARTGHTVLKFADHQPQPLGARKPDRVFPQHAGITHGIDGLILDFGKSSGVRKSTLGAFEHQDLPFEVIVPKNCSPNAISRSIRFAR